MIGNESQAGSGSGEVDFKKRARLEINVNEYGVSFVANVEGYLALARFCTLLAETHAHLREEAPDFQEGEYHLGDYVGDEAVREKRFIFSAGPLRQLASHDPLVTQDILFHVSDAIGADYWKDQGIESVAAKDWENRYSGVIAPVDFNNLAKEIIWQHKTLASDELTRLFIEQAQSAVGPNEKFRGQILQNEKTLYSIEWELERNDTSATVNSFYVTEEDEELVALEVVEDDD